MTIGIALPKFSARIDLDFIQQVFGLRPITGGEVLLEGKPLVADSPQEAIRAGLAYVPDDRKGAGILPDLSVQHNISIGVLERLRRALVIDSRKNVIS